MSITYGTPPPPKNPVQTIDGKEYKVCSKCNELLPINQYTAVSRYNSRLNTRCVACIYRYTRDRAEKIKLAKKQNEN